MINSNTHQELTYCSPNASACYKEVSTSDPYGCSISCTGLYADIEFTEDNILVDSLQKAVTDLVAKGE